MLKELLGEIDRADYLSVSRLATQMGQPQSLVEEGLTALVQMGYLEEQASQNCQDLPCGRCPYASMCAKDPLKTWTITVKGRTLLDRVG